MERSQRANDDGSEVQFLAEMMGGSREAAVNLLERAGGDLNVATSLFLRETPVTPLDRAVSDPGARPQVTPLARPVSDPGARPQGYQAGQTYQRAYGEGKNSQEKRAPLFPDRWREYEGLELQKQAQEIIPDRLWIGPRQVAQNGKDVQNLGITAIVSLLDDPDEFSRVGDTLKIQKRLFSISDTVDAKAQMGGIIAEAVQHTLDLMQNGETVLVHCSSGLSRSATLVIAVMMRRERMQLMIAYAAVFQKRPIINPNDGFFEVLQICDAECRQSRGENLDLDPAAAKQAYNAYQLVAQLRFASVTLPQAQNALHAARGDVEQAASELLAGAHASTW